MASATWRAVSDPLYESGAITMMGDVTEELCVGMSDQINIKNEQERACPGNICFFSIFAVY